MNLSQQTIDTLEEQGYVSLDDYLMSLSTDYGVPVNWVVSLVEMLGEEELFDGLLVYLDGYAEQSTKGD